MPLSRRRHVLVLLRDCLNWIQKGLADSVGVHWRTIQGVERSGRIARPLAQRISKATRVSVEWLLSNDPAAPIRNVDEAPYRGEKEVEQGKAEDSYLKEFNHEEKAFALRSRRMLLAHYSRFAQMIDALGNHPSALITMESKLQDAMLAFIQDYEPARERWKDKPVGETPFRWNFDRLTLKRAQDDLRAVAEIMDAPRSPKTLHDVLVEFLMMGCKSEQNASKPSVLSGLRTRRSSQMSVWLKYESDSVTG